MIFSTKEAIKSYTTKPIKEDMHNICTDFFFEALKLSIDSSSNLIYEFDNLDLSHGIVDDIYSMKIKMFNPKSVMDEILENIKNNFNVLIDDYSKYSVDNITDIISKNKDIIEDYNEDIYYDNSTYVFQNLSSNTTYLNNISKLLITNYERLEDFIKMLKGNREEDAIRNLHNIVIDKDVNRMNSVRGFLLGKDRIEEKDYANELFNFFRLKKLDSGFTMDEARVKSAVHNVFDQSNSIGVIKRETSKFLDLMNDIVNHIESFIVGDRIKSEEGILLYNNIITEYCQELNEICNIYLMYIAAKLDAFKEFNDTNIQVIYKILSKKGIIK